MIKKIKALMMSMSAALLFAVPLGVVGIASATTSTSDIQNCIAQGTDVNGQISSGTCSGNANSGSTSTDITSILRLVINIFSIIVGVIAVIMIIFGGLRYITSGGDSNKITSAKNTIIYAIIGLIIVALAQFVVRFVLTKASDVAAGA